MALSKALLTLSLLATVSGQSESAHGSSDSPVITSTNLPEIVVNPGENYTITCEGHTPVIWNYPNSTVLDNQPRIHVSQKNGKYVSSIQLINITYMDVGYYLCLLDNNSEKNSSIYLFVKDTENLLTHVDMMFAPIYGFQYEDVIIPCKPTHPEVNVTLCRNSDEKLHIGDDDNFGVITYDQKVGFTLENVQMRNNGYYVCCTLPGGICSNECPRNYYLQVLRHADYVVKPAIDNTHLQHVNVGDNVTMECTVTVPLFTKYNLEWIIPNMSDHIIVGDIVLEPPMIPGYYEPTGKIKLTIVNAELEDMGNYTCKVTDHAKNTNSQTIYLKIFERNEAYINLTVNGNITVAVVEEGQDFKWVINVEAHPKPSFTWSRNSTEIKNSSRIFVTSSPDMKQSILEIERVTIQDSGDYEMEATNRNFSKELKLKLIVLGKPHVYMPSYPLKFFHGSSQQVNCTILGRPSPNVTWFFQPDGYKKKKISTEHFKNYVVSEEEGYKTVSELELKATASGTLECLAANKYGSDTEKTQIVIVGVEDIYEPVWFAYQCLESFLLPIYTNKIGLNSETQSRSSETAGEETVDEAEETENYNSLAGTSTPASTVSSPCTSNFKEKSRRGTASNIAEQQKTTAFGQLTNVLSQRQSCANAEEDECDLYGKLLAKKMRELPENDRKLMMYEIDTLFIKRIKQRLFSRETPSP